MKAYSTNSYTDLRVAAINVLRQPRRSLIPLLAVVVGVTAMMLTAGFIDWIYEGMREGTIHSELGHLQVVKRGFYEEGGADPERFRIHGLEAEMTSVRALDGVAVVSPRLSLSGLISFAESTLTFIGEGVDPEGEAQISKSVTMVEGNNLSGPEEKGVILGAGLARNLGVKPGDSVVLMANTITGGMGAVEVKVRGTFVTLSKNYDDTALRIPIRTAHRLHKQTGASRWIVLLTDTDRTDGVRAEVSRILDGKGFEVAPWYQLADFYNKTRELFGKQVTVLKVIIAVIIVLTVSNSFLMGVLERTSEIGTSMALGATRRTILRRFLMEGTLIGFAGGAIGVSLGYVLGMAISHVGIPMPPPPGMAQGYLGRILITAPLAFEAAVLALGAALLASLYPAWRAASQEITLALRHGR